MKQIIGEEFWAEPAVQAARRLKDIGTTETAILNLDIPQDIKIKVANAPRELEMPKQ